jgi:hypothetical protein
LWVQSNQKPRAQFNLDASTSQETQQPAGRKAVLFHEYSKGIHKTGPRLLVVFLACPLRIELHARTQNQGPSPAFIRSPEGIIIELAEHL